jgi:DNA-binding GntR family transcriptional regulator
VADELATDIRNGVLIPRQELSISEIAARNDLRASVLTVTLGGLVRDGLLTLLGDVGVVTALCPRDMRRLSELHRITALEMADRTRGRIPVKELNRLEALLATIDPDRAGLVRPDIWGQAMCEFMRRVTRPVARTSEYHVMSQMIEATHRYQCLGWAAIISESGAESTHALTTLRRRQIANHYDQIDSYRAGSRRAILNVAARREDDTHFIGQASLTRDNVEDLRPLPALQPVSRRSAQAGGPRHLRLVRPERSATTFGLSS